MGRVWPPVHPHAGGESQIRAEDISFGDLEIRIEGKGEKRRDVPVLSSLANELRLHLGERRLISRQRATA